MKEERDEVIATLVALQQAFEQLIVRGLESTGPDDTRKLAALGEQLGAPYLAGLIATLVHAINEHDDDAARALLRAQTAARVFERVLSLDAASEAYGGGTERKDASTPAKGTGEADRALLPVLDELGGLIEGLIDAGLTTASKATLDKLGASFKEASRLKLLRLAASLRYVTDECGRFVADSDQFSARRLAFFLNRSWLLARGLRDAIANGDRAAIARLLLQTTPTPVKSLTAAVVGVQKRQLLDGSAAFEFRMRDLASGAKLVWSCVFGGKQGVAPEAFLHLPQPQKFSPKDMLDGKRVTITDAALTADGRVMLGPKSTVSYGAPVKGFPALVPFDRDAALARIANHHIGPLDLEVELQEELVVTDYELGEAIPHPYRSELKIFPLRAGELHYDAIVSAGAEGVELTAALDEIRAAKKPPPLYGLVHYEMARLVFQPLASFPNAAPRYLMIANEKIGLAALMKTMDFTS